MGYLLLLYPVVFTGIMWGLFILGVSLQSRHKHRFSEPFFDLLKSMFLTVDITYNILVGSLLFLEWPKPKELFTDRVIRHRHYGKGWRKRMGKFICVVFLESVDCDHCK